MDGKFDPYHRWLGIPPSQQPPNHYRLLGLDLFEADHDVIQSAADRQAAHLRTFQNGPHAPLSQNLLNEVIAAKLCLLSPQKKAAYDKRLRPRSDRVKTEPVAQPEADRSEALDIDSLVQGAIASKATPDHGKDPHTAKEVPRISVAVIAAGLLAVAAIVVGVIVWTTRPPTPAREVATNSPASASAGRQVLPPTRSDISTQPDTPKQPESGPAASTNTIGPSGKSPGPGGGSQPNPNPVEPLAPTTTAKDQQISPSKLREDTGPPVEPPANDKAVAPPDKVAPPQGKALPLPEAHHTWNLNGGKDSIEADLEQIEQDTLVLKKSDGSSVRISYDQLNESDQDYASNWVVSEALKIWTPEGTSLQNSRDGVSAQNFELVRAGRLNKALQGMFVKDTLTVVDVSAVQRVTGNVILTVLSAKTGMKRGFVVPMSESVGQQIPLNARLVVDGRLSYKFGVCPACDGTGFLRCTNCSHGRVSHMEPQTVTFPNGDHIVKQVQVFTTCSYCNGTGRLGTCDHVYRGDWEPFGNRKLPDGAYSFLTASNGARRVYVLLNDVRLRIYTPTKVLQLS